MHRVHARHCRGDAEGQRDAAERRQRGTTLRLVRQRREQMGGHVRQPAEGRGMRRRRRELRQHVLEAGLVVVYLV